MRPYYRGPTLPGSFGKPSRLWSRGTTYSPMKEGIHPTTNETTITCTCGAVYHTMSTKKALSIGICAGCHPFYTGEQRLIDTAGRIDKFTQRYGNQIAARRTKVEPAAAEPAAEA